MITKTECVNCGAPFDGGMKCSYCLTLRRATTATVTPSNTTTFLRADGCWAVPPPPRPVQ